MQLRDGAVKGINLAKSLRQAKAALALRNDVSVGSVQTEKTDFSQLSVSVQLKDGVARSSDLDLKSPFLRIGGDGAVDIGKGSIDYTARATVVAVPIGQDGADLAALRGVTVPVHLSGPLDAIQWRISWSAIALATVQDRLKGLLERGVKPAAPGASSPTGSSSTNPRQGLTERLLKGLFK
jgi:AsmA protein